MYRLHGFCQSGNTFKVAFMLRAAKLPWQAVYVDFMNGVTRTPEWRAQHNVMGEAPMLEEGPEDGGRLLTQSAAILLHLADKHGAYGGATDDERQEVLRWLFFDNHKFSSYFANYRWMKAFAPTAPDAAVMAFLRTRVDAAYGVLDKHLAGRRFVVGDAPTIADFSLSGYAFYPQEESGLDVQAQFPNVAAWRERLKKVEGWGDPYEVLPGERIAARW
jgi:glutathione S-transferase